MRKLKPSALFLLGLAGALLVLAAFSRSSPGVQGGLIIGAMFAGILAGMAQAGCVGFYFRFLGISLAVSLVCLVIHSLGIIGVLVGLVLLLLIIIGSFRTPPEE
jgi:hypothetical protein